MNREIKLDKNMQEINDQGDFRFPFNLMHLKLSGYPFYSFPARWHGQIEMTYVLNGKMSYTVNHTTFILEKGDIIFVNANTLHAGERFEDEDCNYLLLFFSPALVYGFEHSLINQNYVQPITENSTYGYAMFEHGTKKNQELTELLDDLLQYASAKPTAYELHVISSLAKMWCYVYDNYSEYLATQGKETNTVKSKQLDRLKNSLAFIYKNFADTITLDEMAQASHTSKSEFCRLFKQTLHQTPFDFLQRYRIEQSLSYLCSDEFSITEIADKVGFSGSSYYAEVFKKYMQCSPTKYRKEHLN